MMAPRVTQAQSEESDDGAPGSGRLTHSPGPWFPGRGAPLQTCSRGSCMHTCGERAAVSRAAEQSQPSQSCLGLC